MSEELTRKGRLPACILTSELMDKLWHILCTDRDISWQAVVGTGGDFLGKQEDRPRQVITEWPELISLLKTLPRIDQLIINAAVAGKGTIGITYKNYAPASGELVVTGQDEEWVDERFNDIRIFFYDYKENFATMVNGKLGFGMVQTAIPLALSFILVMVLAGLIIPGSIRRSEWVWWITAGTVVVTLKLAYVISDRLIVYVLKKYPYIQFAVAGKK